MWGENVGWISLSCNNTGSCVTVNYGVTNDNCGMLAGFAWAENVGWINFAPATGGITIDPQTGDFSGTAWGENIGWITFQGDGTHPYVMRTAWTCDPPPPRPIDRPTLEFEKIGPETLLIWAPVPEAAAFDVAWGFLGTLRATGDFFLATEGCLVDNEMGTVAVDPDIPAPGDGYWYLVRGVNCGGAGSYDSMAPEQFGPRDERIGDSTFDCRVP